MESSINKEQTFEERETERKNKLSVEVADIINAFGDTEQLKEVLGSLNVKKQKTKEDWEKEITKAIELGYFPQHCKRSAMNWGCCAVGARFQIEAPELAKLSAEQDGWGGTIYTARFTRKVSKLGRDFLDAVDEDRPQEAKRIFDEIQALPRIFRTDEEIKYDRLNWLQKKFSKNPYKEACQ